MFRLDSQEVYHAESLAQFPWLEHGFGTRLSNGWPDMSRLISPKQIHSTHVLVAGSDAPMGGKARLGEGDAIVSNAAGSTVGVRTADCLPIIIVDASTRSIGVIHAGWRGTVGDIVGESVRTMLCQFGTQPSEIWSAIGPGIGRCCFEVGPEVAEQFRSIFPEQVNLNHQVHLDLAEANRRLLEKAGVPSGQIEISGLCTKCLAGQFYSYRREREQAGRMITAAGIRL